MFDVKIVCKGDSSESLFMGKKSNAVLLQITVDCIKENINSELYLNF